MDVLDETGCYTSRLLHLLDQQRQTGSHCDVTVVSNDAAVFHAHSAVLAASSPLFSSKLSDGNVGQVILDIEATSIQLLLDALYTGISSANLEVVTDIKLLAESFEMNDVVKLCDGVIVFGHHNNKKLLMVDQAMNTEKISRKKCAVETIEDNEPDSGSELVFEEPGGDPDYRPGFRIATPGKIISVKKRKRGRPPKKKHCREKQQTVSSSNADCGHDSISASEPDTVRVTGHKTRSTSGISKQKSVLRQILTSPRVSMEKKVATIAVSNASNDPNEVVVKRSNINNKVPLALPENLVIEDGEADEAKVNYAFKEIMEDIELENSKVAAQDSKEFKESVSKSFGDIMNMISEKNDEDPVSDKVNHSMMEDWKKCQYCSQFKGKNRGRLDFHLKYCSTDIKCSLCHKPFLNENDLSRHTCKKVPQECVCELCGKTLVGKNALRLHMKIHLDIRNHVCKTCGKRFIRKAHLDAHVSHIHSRERPFSCAQCNSKFALKTELVRHMQKHSEPPQYGCTICGRSFHVKYQAIAHHKVCQKKKYSRRYMCLLCKKYFSDQNEIILHSCLCDAQQNVDDVADQSQAVYVTQDADDCTVLCIVPEDGTQIGSTVPMEQMAPDQQFGRIHVQNVSAENQIMTLEEVLHTVTETQDLIGEEQVLHLQNIQASQSNIVNFQQLQELHAQDLQMKQSQVPVYGVSGAENINIQIMEGVESMPEIAPVTNVNLGPPTTNQEQSSIIVSEQVYAPSSTSHVVQM